MQVTSQILKRQGSGFSPRASRKKTVLQIPSEACVQLLTSRAIR